MKCPTPKYLRDANLSTDNRARLQVLHNAIFVAAKDSKAFRAHNGKYFTLKNDHQKGVNFAAEMTKQYGTTVARILPNNSGQDYLSINVLGLERYNEEFYNHDHALMEQERKWDFDELDKNRDMIHKYFENLNQEVSVSSPLDALKIVDQKDIQNFINNCK